MAETEWSATVKRGSAGDSATSNSATSAGFPLGGKRSSAGTANISINSWTMPLDVTASNRGRRRGPRNRRGGGVLGSFTSTNILDRALKNAQARQFGDDLGLLGEELMSSGLIGEFLVREFAHKSNKRSIHWDTSDLFRWYQKHYGQPDIADRAVNMLKRRDANVSDEHFSQSFESCHTFLMAACERLKIVLWDVILTSWDDYAEADAAIRSELSSVQGNKDALTPIGRFRAKALELLADGTERRQLQNRVGCALDESRLRVVVPEFMLRECPDTDSDANRVFWEYYHKDVRKLEDTLGTAGSKGSKKEGSTLPRQRPHSRQHLSRGSSRQGRLGIGLDSLGLSSLTRLPRVGGDEEDGARREVVEANWSLDRHAKAKRRTVANKLVRERRSESTTLPSISRKMQAAALAEESEWALKEMNRSASDPGIKPLPGVQQTDYDVLPRMLGLSATMTSPTPKKLQPLDKATDAATGHYIRTAHAMTVIPHRSTLPMARSRVLVSRNGEMLTDRDVQAMTIMIPQMDRLEKVDFHESTLVSDMAMVPLLKSLFGRPAAISLTYLCLSGCSRIGRGSIDQVVALLTESDGIPKLRHLDLGGVEIHTSAIHSFCEAIRDHPGIKSLHLPRCRFGIHASAPQYVAILLESPKIEILDLSWNCFTTETFDIMGNSVCAHKCLQELYLKSSSGRRGPNGEAPIAAFLESLSRDRTLQILDISSNLVDHETALVLEDALEYHKTIRDIRINANPLGPAGLRCFLRLFFSESAPSFLLFQCSECSDSQMDSYTGFNMGNPSGRYDLNLANPCDRAVLRMLYKVSDRAGIAPDHAFCHLSYSEGSYSHPSKDSSGIWNIPEVGTFAVTYSIQSAFSKPEFRADPPASVPSHCARKFMEQLHWRFRLHPSNDKMVPFLAYWHRLHGESLEQLLLLEALSHDVSLKYSHLSSLCGFHQTKKGGLSRVDVISKLLHCVSGLASSRARTLFMLNRLDDFFLVNRKCQHFLNFNVDHATGKYFLNLGNPADFSVAESIFVLDRWEAAQAQSQGRVDTSMHGNWSHVRNCVYGQEQQIKLANEWKMPSANTLAFDFVSWRRPPAKALPLRDETLVKLLAHIVRSSCATDDKLVALRRMVHGFFLRAVHLREMLGLFKTIKDRVDVVVTFFHRVTDPYNLKLLRARMFSQDEWEWIASRLGILTCFPFYQPEGHEFRLYFSTYEGRMACSLIVQLSFKEKIENIRNPSFLQEDGTYYSFFNGIPHPWETYATTPEGGQLSLLYVCGPEYRDMGIRRSLAKDYGGWQPNVNEGEITWWTTLNECPEQLLQFVYHCMHYLPDPLAFIRGIVGKTDKSTISRHEFQEAISKEGWKKFQDGEVVRMTFRALDLDNNGYVSLREWAVVIHLWKELQLSALEFLRQLRRWFDDDLDRAWGELDADDSGSIDLEEWLEATKVIGYFGPSAAIFHLIANGDSIDYGSWEKLKIFWEGRKELYDGILR